LASLENSSSQQLTLGHAPNITAWFKFPWARFIQLNELTPLTSKVQILLTPFD